MHLFRILPAVCWLALIACGASPASVCRQQCEKRVSCGQGLDLSQCNRACEGPVPARSQGCEQADLTLQQCQVKQSCADYLASRGCDAEVMQLNTACR